MQHLLDIRMAIDPETESLNAMTLVIRDMLTIPGVLSTTVTSDGVTVPDLSILMGGAGTLIAQLLVRLSDATDTDVEVLVADLREWVDSISAPPT